jgi:hypothetical protein
VVDDGIQRTVLVIGGAAKLDTGRAFGGNMLFVRLHQAGFTNPRFPAEEHCLPFASLGLCPAALQ